MSEKWQKMEINEETGIPIFIVDVCGEKVKAVFDSGADANTISQEYSSLGLKTEKKVMVGGSDPSDRRPYYFYQFSHMFMSDLFFENEKMIVSKGYNDQLPMKLSSGFMFEHKLKIILDYKKNKFLICRELPNRIHISEKFKRIKNHIFVNVVFDGKVFEDFILDTGASLSNLSELMFEKIEVQKDLTKVHDVIACHQVIGTAYSVYAKKITIDAFNSDKVEFFVHPGNHVHRNKIFGVDVNGILGANIFADSILVIDYENETYGIFPSE